MRPGTDDGREGSHVTEGCTRHLGHTCHPERISDSGVRLQSYIHRGRLPEKFVAMLPESVTKSGNGFEDAETWPIIR
jgi:hypothetical protein